MARIKLESIIEHLDYDMKRVLEDAIGRATPHARVDRNELYKEFCRAIGRHCSTWINVSDQHVRKLCGNCGEEI